MKLLVLDFDGVLSDSGREAFAEAIYRKLLREITGPGIS